MEFLIELLLDLVLEGSIEISSNKKVSKFIRYPLIILIILFFSIVIFGLLLLGIMIIKDNILIGLFIIAISLFLLIASIIKFKTIYLNKKENNLK